jgi:hypothetical protein
MFGMGSWSSGFCFFVMNGAWATSAFLLPRDFVVKQLLEVLYPLLNMCYPRAHRLPFPKYGKKESRVV